MDDRQAGRPDRGIGLTDPPGPAHRVGDHDSHGDSGRLVQCSPKSRRAGVGILREQRQFAAVDVGPVDTRRGLHDAEAVLGDECPAFSGDDANGLLIDEDPAGCVPLLGVLRCGHQTSLDLGDDLAGDHEDVSVAQPGRSVDDCCGEIVARTKLGKSRDRQDFDRSARCVVTGSLRHRCHLAWGGHSSSPAARRAVRAITAVVSGSVISNGIDCTSTPSTTAESVLCTSQASRMPVPLRLP